jgi:hypothetical protein
MPDIRHTSKSGDPTTDGPPVASGSKRKQDQEEADNHQWVIPFIYCFID